MPFRNPPTYLLLFLLTFVFTTVVSAQDAQEPLDQIDYQPQVLISPLPDVVNETSGLIFWDGLIWTHNDSGGEAAIYGLNPESGEIQRNILIRNTKNKDWEDITQCDTFIYIGDFGNNSGTRQDLHVLKVAKSAITNSPPDLAVDAEIISFSYADQQDFSKQTHDHNFDCEAMISFGDSLYLFSKNWADEQSKLYILPKKPGTYRLEPRSAFDSHGLITGAGFSASGDELVLIGYQDYVSFMWLFSDFEGSDFLNGTRLRIDFPELVFVQTEGVCYRNKNDVIFSCEKSAEPQQLFGVNTGELKATAYSRLGSPVPSEITISGMPETAVDVLEVDILEVPAAEFTVELRDRRWALLYESQHKWEQDMRKFRVSLPTADLKPGLYFFRIVSGDQKFIKKIEVKH